MSDTQDLQHTLTDRYTVHTHSLKKSASAAAKSRFEEKPKGGEEKSNANRSQTWERFQLESPSYEEEKLTVTLYVIINIDPCC